MFAVCISLLQVAGNGGREGKLSVSKLKAVSNFFFF